MSRLRPKGVLHNRKERGCHAFVFLTGMLLLAAAAAGCGAARPMQYYAMDVPVPARTAQGEPWPVVLLVGHFTAPHLYREDKLVYRTGSNELHTYEYHRWAEPPAEILENVLLSALRASGRYRALQSQRSNSRGDYIVRGRLESFEEIVGPPHATRFRCQVELYETKAGIVVWSQTYSAEEPVQGKGVDGVVQALNRNVERGVAQLASGIEQYFAAHPPH